MTVTVITGTSSGIGLATTKRLAKSGHRVYAGVRNPGSADDLKAAIDEANGAIELLEIDVNDEASIRTAIDSVLSTEGQIDVLVNNAGIVRGYSLEETPLQNVRDLFETNVFGLIAVTQAVVPGMRTRKSGTIINIGSIAGRLTAPLNGFYAASKFAVEAITESLAQQLMPFDIRVAVIEPGFIATPILQKTQAAQEQPDENSPYALFMRRGVALVMKAFAEGGASPVEDVAKVIEHAITTNDPKLRYLVGQDAEDFLAGRLKASDEEYVEMGGLADDDEFYDAAKAMFGRDYFR